MQCCSTNLTRLYQKYLYKIAGYNDHLDSEIVEEITGSRIDANELCKRFEHADLPITKENIEEILMADHEAQGIQELSDDALKYLILNKKQPTIENIYLAQFSSATNLRQSQGYFGEAVNGYYAKKADTIDYEQIEEQMESRIKEAGMQVNDETMEQAKWLIASGIELTEENLVMLSQLQQISFPKSAEEILDLSITAIQNGKSPRKALLFGEKNLNEEAKSIADTVKEISAEAIHETIVSGETINLKNLSQAQKNIDENKYQATEIGSNSEETALREIEARRQLEEIQLMMTVEANKQLLKKGIQIDTTELGELVEALKETENQIRARLYQGNGVEENLERMTLYEETVTKTKEIPFMPAAVLGKVIESRDSFTLSELHESGKLLQSQYTKAGETYEALMTAPRADLGDRISKAFQNIEDILTDLNLETSEENKRAVRILGYNSMNITEKSIAEIKEVDEMISKVIHKMTPATTLQMIREQKNPLEMSMNELEEYLDNKEQISGKDAERFSKYLQKMEHAGNISEEERDAYMGIYRMFRQIEKSDGAIIGNLVATGAEINFKNMLSAVRTRADKNMDVKIDQEFGGLEKLIAKGKAIDEQIQSGFGKENRQRESDMEQNATKQQEAKMVEKHYARISEEITENLSEHVQMNQLQNMDIQESTTIENFANQVREAASEKLVEENMQIREQEFRKSVKKVQEVNDAVLEELINYEIPVSIDHIEAATSLLLDRGSLFKQVFQKKDAEQSKEDSTETEDTGEVEESALQMINSLTDQKTANTSYQELVKKAIKMVDEKVEAGGVKSVDIKAAQALYKGLSLTSKLAKQENYEIPMKIHGEVTSVNLKIYHDSNLKGKVTVTMETEDFGKVVADFDVNDQKVSGMVAYEKADAVMMKELEKEVKEQLSVTQEKKAIHITFAKVSHIDFRQFAQDRAVDDTQADVSTKELYDTAKSFMTALRTCTENQKG